MSVLLIINSFLCLSVHVSKPYGSQCVSVCVSVTLISQRLLESPGECSTSTVRQYLELKVAGFHVNESH